MKRAITIQKAIKKRNKKKYKKNKAKKLRVIKTIPILLSPYWITIQRAIKKRSKQPAPIVIALCLKVKTLNHKEPERAITINYTENNQ